MDVYEYKVTVILKVKEISQGEAEKWVSNILGHCDSNNIKQVSIEAELIEEPKATLRTVVPGGMKLKELK